MVLSVIQNFSRALKYRGGWRGLLEHMYTVRGAWREEQRWRMEKENNTHAGHTPCTTER